MRTTKESGRTRQRAPFPISTPAKLMGYADVSTTMELYSRATDANEQAASDTMNRLLDGKKKQVTNLG